MAGGTNDLQVMGPDPDGDTGEHPGSLPTPARNSTQYPSSALRKDLTSLSDRRRKIEITINIADLSKFTKELKP